MPEPKRILIEMSLNGRPQRFSPGLRASAPVPTTLSAIPGMEIDQSYGSVTMVESAARPSLTAGARSTDDDESADEFRASTYLVRANIAEGEDPREVAERVKAAAPNVVGAFADVTVTSKAVCPGSTAVGTDRDVEALLNVPELRRRRMDGHGVTVAIVDTGFNLEYLRARGKTPNFNAARSWVPYAGLEPGNLPVDHGTMCAYDVCIAAPRCTLIDIALLQSNTPGSTVMEGFLSDAVRAYRHLLDLMLAPLRPGENRSLVVNNSWGMFHPSWDFPVGDPGNYSDNPNHPFNRIVTALERAGADILFAAGNCGEDCADGRCEGVTDRAIYGANSHPQVLSVAGVDVTKLRVGYSSIGPGRLARRKPDLCGFTHFEGSGVYAADGGTSAATPVVAGLVAALRTRLPYRPGILRTSPDRVRDLLRQTAEDVGAHGYDFRHGYGIVNGHAIAHVIPQAEPMVAAPEPTVQPFAAARSAELRCQECGATVRPPTVPPPAAAESGSPQHAPGHNGHTIEAQAGAHS